MPKRPAEADPTVTVELTIRIPGALKNRVAAAAEAAGVSVSAWCTAVLHAAERDGRGLPPPPSPQPVPDVAAVLRAIASGKAAVAPCGRAFPCEGESAPRETVSGLSFCGACGIRVA